MPERPSPLLVLASNLLAWRIPSLSSLLAQISESEDYADFVKLVKTYLPDREQEILRELNPMSQMARFASYFEDRYFPLEESIKFGDFENYRDITYRIPVVVMGLSYDDYHEIPECRPGAQLMTYLIESPWGEEDDNVSLAEACSYHVPDELVDRAGRIRLSPGEADSLLKDTKYRALAFWAHRLHYDTGNFFLDTDYEMLWNSMPTEWDPATVEELTRQWQQAELQDNETGNFMDWLEQDLSGNFEELVSFIEERR